MGNDKGGPKGNMEELPSIVCYWKYQIVVSLAPILSLGIFVNA